MASADSRYRRVWAWALALAAPVAVSADPPGADPAPPEPGLLEFLAEEPAPDDELSERISPEVFLKLREALPNAEFVKVETQPPGRYVSQLVERSGGRLKALVGYAGVQMPDVLARGAVGIQPGCSFTEIYVELWKRWQTDKDSFQALHNKLLPYINYWMQGVELIVKVEKVILQRRGIIASDYCRSPAYALDQGELAQIERFMSEFAEWLN